MLVAHHELEIAALLLSLLLCLLLLLSLLLLCLQGIFVECAGAAPIAAQLAACVLELVRSPGVQGHPQPYVRRSALLAAAQVGCANPVCTAYPCQLHSSKPCYTPHQ